MYRHFTSSRLLSYSFAFTLLLVSLVLFSDYGIFVRVREAYPFLQILDSPSDTFTIYFAFYSPLALFAIVIFVKMMQRDDSKELRAVRAVLNTLFLAIFITLSVLTLSVLK